MPPPRHPLPARRLRAPGQSWVSGRKPSSRRGFTLLELLIAVVLGSAVLSSVITVITGHVRGTRTQELAQRTRDDATRLNYLIQTEASEAFTTTPGAVISNCAAAANGQTSLFGLTIPRPTAQFDDVNNVAVIYYYSATNAGSTDLKRCGPPIRQNGSLDFGASPVDGIVSANTTLSLVTCNGTSTSSREVAYQLQLNDVSPPYTPACAIARARAFRVQDPLIP